MINPIILPFGKTRTIRASVIDGSIWFVASDLFRVFKIQTCRAFLSTFCDEDLRLETLKTDAGPKRYTLVSILGALTVATFLRDDGPLVLDAWVRREVRNLSIEHGTPATIPMTFGAHGDYLVHPRMKAGHFQESVDFRRSTPIVHRNLPRPGLPVLFDDDDNAESDELQATNAAFLTTWIEKNTR